MDCCVIKTNSWTGTVFWTAAWSPADFEVEMSIPGKLWKAGESARWKRTKSKEWVGVGKKG